MWSESEGRGRVAAALAILVAGVWPAAGVAGTAAELAADRGCLACHGTPPRRATPSLEQLAQGYVKYRGQADAAQRLATRLREGSLFGHIAAHERLSQAECEELMQWLIDGAP